jgi:hypothetical protein
LRTGCGPLDYNTDQEREDKLVRVQQGKYYGHPNPKRAVDFRDPRQGVGRNPTRNPPVPYTNYPCLCNMQLSSAGGLMEYIPESNFWKAVTR